MLHILFIYFYYHCRHQEALEQAIVSQPVVAFDFERTERCDKIRYQFSRCEMKEIGARAVTKGKGPRFPPGCCELDPFLLS